MTTTAPVNQFTFGMTHTQHSADAWGDPTAVSSARSIAKSLGGFQDQAIMGWGVTNPEPAPGVFDFTDLDRRVAFMRSSGATPVITLAGAPDWMKGGRAGETDWSKIEVAPTVAHYADFAALAAKIARRYPDVVHFMVWNELKGFFDQANNRWDAYHYTALYNAVYDALKAVNPAIAVGGPYVVMDSWTSAGVASNPSNVSGLWGVLDQRPLDVVTYWLAHAHGADFVAIDAASGPRDAPASVDPAVATEKFAAVDAWLRARTRLPIWWAEFYVQPRGVSWTRQHQASVQLFALLQMQRSGAAAAFLWQPEASASSELGAVWTQTATLGGGKRLPFGSGVAALERVLAPAGSVAQVTIDTRRGIATIVGSSGLWLAVNAGGAAQTVTTPSGSVTLGSRLFTAG